MTSVIFLNSTFSRRKFWIFFPQNRYSHILSNCVTPLNKINIDSAMNFRISMATKIYYYDFSPISWRYYNVLDMCFALQIMHYILYSTHTLQHCKNRARSSQYSLVRFCSPLKIYPRLQFALFQFMAFSRITHRPRTIQSSTDVQC